MKNTLVVMLICCGHCGSGKDEVATFHAYWTRTCARGLMLGPITEARVACSEKRIRKDQIRSWSPQDNTVFDVTRRSGEGTNGKFAEVTGEVKLKSGELKASGL